MSRVAHRQSQVKRMLVGLEERNRQRAAHRKQLWDAFLSGQTRKYMIERRTRTSLLNQQPTSIQPKRGKQ
jgi:hypothetical protein